MQKIELTGLSELEKGVYPKYKLVDGGTTVQIEVKKDRSISYKIHHIGPDGVLCDDLETFVKWEMFS